MAFFPQNRTHFLGMPLIERIRNRVFFDFVLTPLASRGEDGRVIEAGRSVVALMKYTHSGTRDGPGLEASSLFALLALALQQYAKKPEAERNWTVCSLHVPVPSMYFVHTYQR